MSIGLSFGESGSADRPRSLTSAVQERLRTVPYRYPDEPGLHCDVSNVRDVESKHAAIVEAVVRRDADAAVDALAKHFNVTMRFVEQNAPEIAEVGSFRK